MLTRETVLLFSFLALGTKTMGFESVLEFSETFREKKCALSRQSAHNRVLRQAQSGSDVYEGPTKKYHGMKILRFIESEEGCESIWSEFEGKLYDYHLRIQVNSIASRS